MQNEYTKNKKLIKNKIMIHRICISNILAWDKNIPCKKNFFKKKWMIYPTTYPISCLVEHRIGYVNE